MEEKKKNFLEKNIAELLREIPRIRYQQAFLRLLLSFLKLKKLKKTPYAAGVIRVSHKAETLFAKNAPAWQKESIQKCKKIALGLFSGYSEEETRDAFDIIISILPDIYTDMKIYIGREMKKRIWSTLELDNPIKDEKEWIVLATKDALEMFHIGEFRIFLFKKEDHDIRTIQSLFFSVMKEYLLHHGFSNIIVSDGYLIAERCSKYFAAITSVENSYFVISTEEGVAISS